MTTEAKLTPGQEAMAKQLARTFVVLPHISGYLHNQPEGGEPTFDAWARLLDSSCDPDDVAAAVDDLEAGDWSPDEKTPYGLFAHQLKSRADRKTQDRRQREAEAFEKRKGKRHRPPSDRRPGASGLAAALSAILKADTPQARKAATENAQGVSEALRSSDEEYGPRFRCLTCSDTGVVPCIDPTLLQRIVRMGIDEFNSTGERIKPISFACSCDRGQGLREGSMTGKITYAPVPVFDPEMQFRCLADTPQSREQLRQYIEGDGSGEVQGPIWTG